MSRVIDKNYAATVVSLVPFPLNETKPGIYPGEFRIEACKKGIPEVLQVGVSIYHVEVDENRSVPVKCAPQDIARSIVEDYLISNLAYFPAENAAPGIMWVAGYHDTYGIQSKFKKELDELRQTQWNWFIRLVQMADDDWEKSGQHKFISDMQRFAAKELGLQKPWIIEPNQSAMLARTIDYIKCIACQSAISREAIICPNCKMILDEDKWKKLKFVGA